MDHEKGKRLAQSWPGRIWAWLHATYKLSVRPAYDFEGDNLRVVLFWLMLAFILICVRGWLALIPAVNDREVTLSLLMFLIPFFAAGFALGQIDRRSRTFQLHSKTYEPLTSPWLNWLAEHNPIIKRRMLSFLRQADPMYRAIFWIAYGILIWGWGNIFWLFLQVFVTHDLVNAPPDWMAHDLFYIQLEVGWLLGVGEIGKFLSDDASDLKSQTGSFLRMMAEAALQTVRLIKSLGATALICMGAIFVGNMVIVSYSDGRWFNLAGVDRVDVLLAVAYGILDGAALATVIWLWTHRPRIEEKQRTSALSFGLRWLGWGWLVWPFITWAILYGFREPAGRPLHYTVGSLYDIVGIVAVGVMIQGLFLVTCDTCGSHPSFSRFTESERHLAALLLSDRTNAQIAVELGKAAKTLEGELTRLYNKAEIWGFDGAKKRTQFLAVYRRQIEACVRQQTGSADLYDSCAAVVIEDDAIRASRLVSKASSATCENTLWRTDVRDILALSDWLSQVECTNVVVSDLSGQQWKRVSHLLAETGRWLECIDSEPTGDTEHLCYALRRGRLGGKTIKITSESPVAALVAARRELVRQRDRVLRYMLEEAGEEGTLHDIIRGMAYVADADSRGQLRDGKSVAALQGQYNTAEAQITSLANGRERILYRRAEAYGAMREWLNEATGAQRAVWDARMAQVSYLDEKITEKENQIAGALRSSGTGPAA